MAGINWLVILKILVILVKDQLFLLLKQLKYRWKPFNLTNGAQYHIEIVSLLVLPVGINSFVNYFLTNIVATLKPLLERIYSKFIFSLRLPWKPIIKLFERVLEMFELQKVLQLALKNVVDVWKDTVFTFRVKSLPNHYLSV